MATPPGARAADERRRRIATLIAVAAVGLTAIALVVAAIGFLHGATTLPAPAHP